MNINTMRELLAKRYSPDFAKRLNKMDDDQVIAIYHRVIESDRTFCAKKDSKSTDSEPEQVHEKQLSLF